MRELTEAQNVTRSDMVPGRSDFILTAPIVSLEEVASTISQNLFDSLKEDLKALSLIP
jgi:hypothetical protein